MIFSNTLKYTFKEYLKELENEWGFKMNAYKTHSDILTKTKNDLTTAFKSRLCHPDFKDELIDVLFVRNERAEKRSKLISEVFAHVWRLLLAFENLVSKT